MIIYFYSNIATFKVKKAYNGITEKSTVFIYFWSMSHVTIRPVTYR
jgi:hypothetical protein